MLDNLELIGTGFAAVMVVLAALWGASALVAMAVRAIEERQRVPPAPAQAAAQSAAAPALVAPGVPPHHLAAIAAAVAHSLGAKYRVTNVLAPAHHINEWPLEGRFETFTAHRIRTNWGPTFVLQACEYPNKLRGHQK